MFLLSRLEYFKKTMVDIVLSCLDIMRSCCIFALRFSVLVYIIEKETEVEYNGYERFF